MQEKKKHLRARTRVIIDFSATAFGTKVPEFSEEKIETLQVQVT